MKPRRKPHVHLLVVTMGLSLCLLSCSSGTGKKGGLATFFEDDPVSIEDFKTAMAPVTAQIDPSDSLFRKQLLRDVDLNVKYAYRLSGNEPIWFESKGIKSSTAGLVQALAALSREGLDTTRYHLADIRRILAEAGRDQKGALPVDSVVRWDKALTAAYLTAARDLLMGKEDIRKADDQWFAANDTAFNGARYLVEASKNKQQLPALDTFRPLLKSYNQMIAAMEQWQQLKQDSLYLRLKAGVRLGVQDSSLQAVIGKELPGIMMATGDSGATANAIATYQYYHQLRITGKNDSATYKKLRTDPDAYVQSLQMNMDRLRALPREIGAEHVWVTIPLMEVDYYRDNDLKWHSRVVVGKKARQTPTLWAPMANVVFNPPWGVPPTILKNDVGPGVSRAGAGYLARKGLRAFDAKGRDVTEMVNGENYKRFSYRQPPGAHNSLGEIKFNLPNKWDIYLHDTPHRGDFGLRSRALSSGCVRVQNPKDFAEVLLSDRGYGRGRIDSVIETRKTKLEPIKRPLPVYIVYLTVAPDSTGTGLRYLDDVYGRDIAMRPVYGF
ncbi:L,D-transpeptidase family protein [Taibaiella chishuiensis]|uniref:Murein L,D-transpeptidase YcbB/YkuD n=1 Tax=Taibaiella chishuiensis TaxID=1434707 RepID=A0A2P8D0K0_9BACT|nr:L,D-transpeptidase family protein [Taibaiella chishuiensis]PSK90752.1 murein L,D-transpeptidase YcbB/YkuD [Taibaiella chishuiensis]